MNCLGTALVANLVPCPVLLCKIKNASGIFSVRSLRQFLDDQYLIMLSIFEVCPLPSFALRTKNFISSFLKTSFKIVEGGLSNFKVINDFIELLESLEDARTIHKIS